MKMTSFAFACMLSSISMFAYAADLTIHNNTNRNGTARTNTSPCSSAAGGSGVARPQSTLSVPQMAFDLFCINKCDVMIYASSNCSGKSIATLKVDQHRGVLSINNHNNDGYVVSGGGSNISVDGGPALKA